MTTTTYQCFSIGTLGFQFQYSLVVAVAECEHESTVGVEVGVAVAMAEADARHLLHQSGSYSKERKGVLMLLQLTDLYRS